MIDIYLYFLFFFFKQKTAYEMRISDWSSDVCSSDLSVYEAATQSSLTRRNRNFSPFSRLHVFNRPVADTPSHKSQGRMTDGCRHPAHLTVSPFAACRSEARRVGQACVITCSSRWSQTNYYKTTN